MNLILLAIPFFVLLISIEVIVDRVRKTGFYRVNDSISSMNAGLLSRVIIAFKKLIPLTIYIVIEKNYALFDFQESAGLWFFSFIIYDFCYYWSHRFGHEINVLWASHVVHHSSEEYNLTTALRQTSGSILSWIFYIPMALAGIDPIMLISVGALNLIYQFWVHTRHISKLGWYEVLFVTPSHHRVHHATNECYIDRNYGGVFIIWDKMFNTFQEEIIEEPCIYGIRKAVKSWNPIWVNLHFYTQLAKDAWRTQRWQDKLLIWFKPTGWRPVDMEEKYPLAKYDPTTFVKFDNPIPKLNTWYSLFQHFTAVAAIVLLLKYANVMNSTELLLFGGFIIFSCYSIGAILQGRRWAVWLEYIRYSALLYYLYSLNITESTLLLITGVAIVSLIATLFLKPAAEPVQAL